MAILSFGEILWDVYPDNEYIGGAPLNFAAHLAKLGERVYMLSAVGKDKLGFAALKKITQWGIKTDFVKVSDEIETGKCLVTLGEDSLPRYNLLDKVAYDSISADGIKGNYEVLYFGTLALRSQYNFDSLKKLTENNDFKHIFVDVNIRPPFYSEKTVKFAAENATIIKISLEEMGIFGELADVAEREDYRRFAAELNGIYKNLQCIIITLGDMGAFAIDCTTGKEYFCPAVKTEAVSAVGAGDSFSAAFLHKYLKGEKLDKCLEFASLLAGFVVGHYDAVPEYKAEDFE